MGLFWEDVTGISIQKKPDDALLIKGDPEAWNKHWWNDPLWRIQHNWSSLQILHNHVKEDYRLGFHIYFQSSGRIMVYRKPIHTPYILVRRGPEDTFFWATKGLGYPVQLAETGAQQKGLLRQPVPLFAQDKLKREKTRMEESGWIHTHTKI